MVNVGARSKLGHGGKILIRAVMGWDVGAGRQDINHRCDGLGWDAHFQEGIWYLCGVGLEGRAADHGVQ